MARSKLYETLYWKLASYFDEKYWSKKESQKEMKGKSANLEVFIYKLHRGATSNVLMFFMLKSHLGIMRKLEIFWIFEVLISPWKVVKYFLNLKSIEYLVVYLIHKLYTILLLLLLIIVIIILNN